MNKKVTIIMYHYVRELTDSRYPGIKGLDIKKFDNQIQYIKKNYHVIRMQDFVDALKGKIDLPNNPALLTFDDGYIDHYNNVLPILLNNKLQGSFFIPARILSENIVLDVNKIHFILECCKDLKSLIREIFELLDKYRLQYSLESNEYYYSKLAIPNRFDSSDIIFVKRVLQSELNIELRKKIVDNLFLRHIKISENIFSKELYVNYNQIKMMINCGMHIGAHGYNHLWLGKLDEIEQENEIVKSISFLEQMGIDMNYRTMCYPYGSYNEITIQLLKKHNFDCAFTTVPTTAHFDLNTQFEIPRLDTNDLPIK
jgi:peptidoglycan/xylan/chitin deacetylase (PgdA/CDA1 family)